MFINDGSRCIRCGYDTSVDSAHVCMMPATLSDMISQRTYNCDWVQDDMGNWDTMCGNAFTVNDGTPSENGMKYCPYCGKPLNEVMP